MKKGFGRLENTIVILKDFFVGNDFIDIFAIRELQIKHLNFIMNFFPQEMKLRVTAKQKIKTYLSLISRLNCIYFEINFVL